jgi:MFS family permease
MLANNYGRKKVIMFGVVFGASSIIICGFMKTISLVMVLFFLAGFSLSGQETVVYVYITEISGKNI